jgi:2-phosphoglycerate kinase
MKITLITGAPGVGKSYFAEKLAKERGCYSVISSDTVREIMRVSIPRTENSEVLHRSAILAGELAPDGEDQYLWGFQEQARMVKPGIEAVITQAIKQNRDTIIEGIHLIPGLFESDDSKYELEHIVLTVSDSKIHEQRIVGQGDNRSSYKLENFTKARKFQDYLRELAKQNNTEVIENI